ncbi:hypothetical protein MMC14_004178 [Varicellaria rhodocarpa]|nr:hypothetical protein [Varicellaria rhodocarpa]
MKANFLENKVSKSINSISSPISQPCTNSAADRSCWGEYGLNTNYYTEVPDTGVTREYWLEITNMTFAPDGVERDVLLVNGSLPGPTLECDWGDTLIVHVTNSLANNGSTMHWHGVRQNGTNPMDGVPSITQCPSTPGDTYTYTWRSTQYGSSWYHSHFALQAWEGVFGGIVMHGPATSNYDEDKGVLFLNDWTHETSDALYEYALTQGPPTQDTGLINGTNVYDDAGSRFETTFISGTKYLMRVINGAMNNAFNFQIDNHTLTIIAADFVPVQPYTTDYLIINIGQRYDVIVEANQEADNYWIRAIPQISCAPNSNANNIKGIVRYGSSTGDPVTTGYAAPDNCGDMPSADLVPYLKRDVGVDSLNEDMEVTSGRDSVTDTRRWFIDGTAMEVAWTNPILQQIYESDTTYSNSSNVYQLPTANVWTYVIIETNDTGSHPIHLHGHDFSILASGNGTYASAAPTLNLNNPTRRDTATLPITGYLVLAFYTDNPGAWLMHCHIGWHVEMGFAIQWLERYDEIKPLVDYETLKNTCSAWDTHRSSNDVVEDNSGV